MNTWKGHFKNVAALYDYQPFAVCGCCNHVLEGVKPHHMELSELKPEPGVVFQALDREH